MFCSNCGKKMDLEIRCYCENIENERWYKCKVKLDKDGQLKHIPIKIKEGDYDISDWEYKVKCKNCGNTQKLYVEQVKEQLKAEDKKLKLRSGVTDKN